MPYMLMHQLSDPVTPGSYHIDWEAKTIVKLPCSKSPLKTRSKNRRIYRNRKPSFVIPPLPVFEPPEVPHVVVKKRNPDLPRVILPPPRFYEGPKITWPDVDLFKAVYLGTDENNRVVLKFIDEKSVESYTGSKGVWGVFHVTLGKDAKISISDLEVGLLVIASHKRHGQDNFFRAKVLSIQKEAKTAIVRDVDEWDQVEVHENNLYWMNDTFLNIHFQAIICELRGMNFFNGSPVIQQIMDESLGKWFPTKGVVCVTYFEKRNPYPLVNFAKWPYPGWTTEVDVEVKNILKLWRPELPKSTGMSSQNVMVSHADELGNIWLQMNSNLTYFLTQLKLEDFPHITENSLESEKIEKAIIKSIEGGEKMFLGRYTDNVYYRCRLVTYSSQDKLAEVEFVDFGNSCSIKVSQMVSYEAYFGKGGAWVKYIKPQCVKAHMKDIDVMNLDSFWEYVQVDMRHDITISLVQRKDRSTPQVELYNYPNGDEEKHHVNKSLLRKSNVARNIGDREIGVNIRIPGTKKYLTPALVASYEADIVEDTPESEEDWFATPDSDSEDDDLGLDLLFGF